YFAGYVDEAAKCSLIDQAWVLAQPSAKEGWGLTVIEAAARGVPTVAFDVPGLRDAIQNEITGVLVADQTAEALAIGLLELLTDRDRRMRMASAARTRARQFTWDRLAMCVESQLVALAEGQRRQPLLGTADSGPSFSMAQLAPAILREVQPSDDSVL